MASIPKISSTTLSVSTIDRYKILIFPDTTMLSLLEVIACNNILEDAIDQVMILGSLDFEKTVAKDELEIDSIDTRARKYIKHNPIYNFLNGERFEHTMNKMRYLKLQIDRTFIEDILLQTKNELRDDHNFQTLLNFLRNYRSSKKEEDTLISEESNNREYSSALRVAIRKKMEESTLKIRTMDEEIAKCKDEIETILFDNTVKKRYIENWENARIEQGFMVCDKNETEQLDIINKYKSEIEKEIRINSELVSYILENQKDIEEGIDNWTRRYETELEERQTEIQVLKDRREEQQKRYEEMLRTYDEHAQAITEYLALKERKRLEGIRNAKRLDASIRIQAWWRGLMVRLQLGPFNPKKKKKKGKGKKK